MTIFLIRHGRTEANDRHLYCGSTDLCLSEGGRAELRRMPPLPQSVRFFTSGMRRTEQTLALLYGDVPHTQEPAFRELDFGIFEMHSYAQLKDSAEYQAWLSGDNEANVAPGGESGRQMTARVLSALDRIDGDAVIVTHGGPIAAIMAARFPEAGKNRYEWQPRPGCGWRIWEADGAWHYAPLP